MENTWQIAVLLPCYNEGKSIAQVVVNFRKALPSAQIYVYDNNSTDDTAAQASLAGAKVVPCRRRGKGNVVRQMFADIEADIYVMADGDGTYDHTKAPTLIQSMIDEGADMAVGKRRYKEVSAERKGHAWGNRTFNRIYQALFADDFTDIFSGYRAFTRRYVKSFPAESQGFEIETEMSVHASVLRLPVVELEFDYGKRSEGSESKLSTVRDGIRILTTMIMLMKETKPFRFFGILSAVFFFSSIAFMFPVLVEYFNTGLVDRIPTWVLAMTLFTAGMMAMTAGTILDSVARGRAEQRRVHYLSISPLKTSPSLDGVEILFPRTSGKVNQGHALEAHYRTGGSVE
ncbi:MAG: glycosyltransferase [Pseudomonadota bacterium]